MTTRAAIGLSPTHRRPAGGFRQTARLAILALCLVTGGCYGLIPPEPVEPARIPPPPLDRRPVPLRFGALKTDIRYATPLDGGLISLFCRDSDQQVIWGDVNAGALKEQAARAFHRVMSDAGFDVGGDPGLMFAEEQEADALRAILVVSARITDVRPVFCQQPAGLRGLIGIGPVATLGEVDLRVTWAVFSRLERRTLFRTETFGRAASGRPRFSGTLLLLEEAFADAAERLAADGDFRALVFARHPLGPLLTGPASRDLVGRDPPPAPGPGPAPAPAGLRLYLPQRPLRTRPLAEDPQPVLAAAVMIEAGAGHGSGVFIAPACRPALDATTAASAPPAAALVLTNAHVIGDAEQVRITSYDGPARVGTVLRRHLARDVALIAVTGEAPAVLAIRRTPVTVGEPVYAIGAPHERARHHTLTSGIVSRISRDRMSGLPLIESDVTIHPGASGGPLVDRAGNLVALAVAGVVVADGAAGIGLNDFIPITDALRRLALVPEPPIAGAGSRPDPGDRRPDSGPDPGPDSGYAQYPDPRPLPDAEEPLWPSN